MLSLWERFWMRHAGLNPLGRIATYLASFLSPPYKARTYLSRLNAQGYVAPNASIRHDNLQLGANVFVGDRVVIHQASGGGMVKIGKAVQVHRDCIFETGAGGSLTIAEGTSIQPRCQFSAYVGAINIGSIVQIAPNCAFYSYDHAFAADGPIKNQPLKTKGGIVVGDDVWFGFGVIVLDGVQIGCGAVVGAGSVVTRDIPASAIAAGVPARVLKMRSVPSS